MTTRYRTTSTLKTVDQENAHATNAKPALGGTRIPRRAALGDIATNTVVNKPKIKDPIKKTVPLNQIQKPKEVVKTKLVPQKSDTSNQTLLALAKYSNPLANLRPLQTRQTSAVNTKSVKAFKFLSPVVIPDSVRKVDENDTGKIFLVPEYVNDIYKYLLYLESQFSIQPKYLTGQYITPRMRSILIDWLVDVQQQYHLLTETLHLCVAIIDLFLQKLRVITKDKLQLVGVTALFIACKYEETYSPDISDFVYITDSSYTKEQIISLERTMVRKLNFSFGRPSSINFLRRYSKVADISPLHHSFGKYFLDLALLNYSLVHVRPSLVAAVAAFISYSIYKCETEPSAALWDENLTFYSKYSFADLKPYIPIMATAILKAPESSLQAVQTKFSSSDLLSVSSRPELQTDNLKKLAEGI